MSSHQRHRHRASRRVRRALLGLVAAGTAIAAASATGSAVAAPSPVDLQILSFNDYHGQVDLPSGGNATLPGVGAPAPGEPVPQFGGAQYLATTLKTLRAGKKNTLTVAAGDLIGASPIVSGLFHDEPSIESLNAMRLDVSSVGNHEFDEGVTELLRMQYGGCRADSGCYLPNKFPGARFGYLAANVVYNNGVKVKAPAGSRNYGDWFKSRTGRTVLPPTWVKEIDDIKVGFIGMTLESTSELVAQAGVKDVTFKDEVVSANLAAADLAQRGVRAIVVLIHEGGLPPSGAAYNFPCTGENTGSSISGPIVDIAKGLDARIDMVISGHTHQPYTCVIPDPAGKPRWVTSAYAFGRLVTESNLQLDRRTKDVIRSSVTAVNRPVARTVAPDPQQTSILTKWQALAAPIANRAVGSMTATDDFTRAFGITRAFGPATPPANDPNGTPTFSTDNRAEESALGDLIADAQLDRTAANGAQIAFMNSGGIRADLSYAGSAAGEGDGNITYGEAFLVQPFSNSLVTLTLTGAQIEQALEQQFIATRSRPILINGVSRGFAYTYSASAPFGDKIDPASITLNGTVIDPAASYRVTVNNFLADGGDGFAAFRSGTNRVGGGIDLDEFVAWLGANSPVTSLAVNPTTRDLVSPRITIAP